jgi:deoxyribonuclease-1
LAVVLLLIVPQPAWAAQTVIPDYRTAREDYFWTALYAAGGESIYCEISFPKDEHLDLTVEHAYPAHWIAEGFGCEDRNNCDHPLYGFAEADLHNLWPAHGSINSSRSDLPFGTIPGENERRFESFCEDYERSSDPPLVEPRDGAKGDLARSILYMAIMYGLPLQGLGPVLMKWHLADPPDEHERARNHLIERLQGTRNWFIDAEHSTGTQ